MPRKRHHPFPGQPPKDMLSKISGASIRALTSIPVKQSFEAAANKRGLSPSDYLRLAIYHQLVKDGVMTEELLQDQTWAHLRDFGLA